MAKISSFIIALLLCSGVVAIIGLFVSEMSQEYSVTYDNDSMAVYNQLQSLSNQTEQVQEGVEGITEKSGVIDVIGSYFSSAYRALKITTTSFNTFDTMADQAIDDANMGAAGSILKTLIGAIVIIAIFVGVIISALLKKDV